MQSNNEHGIIVKGLTKSYKNLKVLEGVDFVVPKGKMLALLGPNGAGKTTTVRILATLIQPDAGEACIEGVDVFKDPKKVKTLIGLTGQYAAIDEQLTGEENLIMMGELYHLGKEESVRRAKILLEQFGLVEAGSRNAKTYSGGMKRRLDLALSLVATPPVLFLDEPTTGLDPRARADMWNVIKRLMKDGVTILLTTQYLEEADQLADSVAVLDHGRIIAQGTPDELKQKVGSDMLEFTIAHAGDLSSAVKALGEGAVENKEDRTASVPIGKGLNDVKRIIESMEKTGIEIETMSIKKPTLDDVFLRLTGHHTS